MLDQADIAQILNDYRIGALEDAQPLTAGTVQTNLLLRTSQGPFVLRYYRQNRSFEAVLFEVHLINYLKRKGYPCPGVIRNVRGKYAGVYGGRPYAIFEFIAGEHVEEPTAAQQAQLIQQVAELHNLTKRYRPTYTSYRWNYNVAFCAAMATAKANELATRAAQEKLAWYRQELAKLVLPAALPKGVCHADFHFSNMLFQDGHFHALLDFDDANYTYLTFDLTTLIEPFTFRWDTWQEVAPGANAFDFSAARQTVAHYQRYRPLNALERKYFFDVVKLGIFIDCLWFFSRGMTEDFYEKRKIDALDDLGRDRFCRALF
ncbi:MAG: homoserine kinase [Caldilineaceae bacterium]